jgi:hypothetical protein
VQTVRLDELNNIAIWINTVSLLKTRQSPIEKSTPRNFFELAPNIKSWNWGAVHNETIYFFALKYRARPGLHGNRNFCPEIASCAKFFLSRLVFAEVFHRKKGGLRPFQSSKIFYFVIGVLFVSRGSSEKN